MKYETSFSSFPMKKVTLSALAALALALHAGPAANAAVPASSAQPSAVGSSTASNQVYNQFESLLKKGRQVEAIKYLNANIAKVSRQQATLMVLHLENELVKVHSGAINVLSDPKWQAEIDSVYKPGDTFMSVLYKVKDWNLRSALKNLSEMNYRLETSEGLYYPVIRYAAFQKYGKYVAADIKAYIDIMTVETEKAAAKDGAIAIGYQELANRALAQERFIASYPGSNRASQVKSLFKNYKAMTFYGLNNTPLFHYDTKKMQPNAIKGYELILQANKGKTSGYLKLLQQFMEVAKDNGYKLTPEVDKFRKANV
ncbi:hypothetical protein [Paenibacillus gansuensis]|uniref:Uncharacterized protein n=1 Tax=Paenibacillus gansuensis TaxID=306542 RepID=A0ABW5PAA4_9BACL